MMAAAARMRRKEKLTMDAETSTPAWMLITRGIVALVFGVLALMWPQLTLLWLVALFAIFAIITGVTSIVGAVQVRRMDSRWWVPLLLGIVSVIAGVYALVWPGLTALLLIIVMGVNALITGVLDVAMAVRLRDAARGRGMLVLSGVVAILFGAIVIWAPGAGALALVWMVSFYAIVTGVLLLGMGLRLRRLERSRPLHDTMATGGP
jgi:uncharacterized membrane protein HdeD (DUF308 family)